MTLTQIRNTMADMLAIGGVKCRSLFYAYDARNRATNDDATAANDAATSK